MNEISLSLPALTSSHVRKVAARTLCRAALLEVAGFTNHKLETQNTIQTLAKDFAKTNGLVFEQSALIKFVEELISEETARWSGESTVNEIKSAYL